MAAPMSHTARQRRQALRFAVAAGVAAWDGRESLDALLRRADVALYTAKTDGGSRVEIAPPTLEPSEAFPAD
jgi:PleD family two-component response regulator